MNSLRSKEGFLLIDNRHAPDAQGRTGVFEMATITCHHCQAQMIRNPSRERERAFCTGCGRYVCDRCKAIAVVAGCKPYAKVLDDLERKILRERTS